MTAAGAGAVGYCAVHRHGGPWAAGQHNLSRPVLAALEQAFDVTDLSPRDRPGPGFPSAARIVLALARLLLARRRHAGDGGAGGVTVVDMVHSLAVLPPERFGDRLIVLGHDSYALRAGRDLARAQGLAARLRLRLVLATWRLIEAGLRRVAWRIFFVSPVDQASFGADGSTGTIAIPVAPALIETGLRLRQGGRPVRGGPPRILVPLPVRNPAQNRIDAWVVERLAKAAGGRAVIVLWGKGAAGVAAAADPAGTLEVVDWVDDYAGFLAGFDLLVYPRLVGSGFHTKLAEALVLGVPCLCASWVAAPLRAAGYDGLATFEGESDFTMALAPLLDGLVSGGGLPRPGIPERVSSDVALGPLIDACRTAMVRR